MSRTNRPADLSRQEADPNRRITRSSTRRPEPPLIISEPRDEPPRAQARKKRAAQKGKGKAKAVDPRDIWYNSDEDLPYSEMSLARERFLNTPRDFGNQGGEPSTRGGPSLDPWYDDETLERDYLDTDEKREAFQEFLSMGYERGTAYMCVERTVRKNLEEFEKRRHIKEDASEAFRINGFEGTYYAHYPTLSELGLREDFAHLARSCGLETFLRRSVNTYVDETIDFLCSVVVHLYDRRIINLQNMHGGGYITFTVRGTDYKCTLEEIGKLFSFPDGSTLSPEVARPEINAVWKLLTGRPVFAGSNDKGNWIRNPAINYFRRAVANTLYARDTTGNVNMGEAHILVRALRGVTRFVGSQELIGDTVHSSYAFLLACHLMDYRGRAIVQAQSSSTKKRRCCIGGVACAIMRMAGVRFREYQVTGALNDIGHRLMNVDYLQRAAMLHKGSSEVHLYRFIHPERRNAYIRLPRDDLVRIRPDDQPGPPFDRVIRAMFTPPLDELVDPAEDAHPHPPEEEPEAAGPEANEDEAAEPVIPPARRGRAAPRRQDQRMNLLARMQKSMLKSLNKLVRRGKDHERRIATLEAENREFRARHSTGDDRGITDIVVRDPSPIRYSFAGTEYYQQGEQGGPSYYPDDPPYDPPQ